MNDAKLDINKKSCNFELPKLGCMKVLFDFEIFDDIPIEATDYVYEITREFFIQKFEAVGKEIDEYLAEEKVAIIIICLHGDSLKTIPFNVPEHLIGKLNAAVTQEEFDDFQDRIIAMEKSSLN